MINYILLSTGLPILVLTFVNFTSHNLSSTIVKTDRQARTVGFHITIITIVPMYSGYFDRPRDVGQFGPDTQNISALNCKYFHTHQF